MANAAYSTEKYGMSRLAFEFFDDFIGEIDTTNVYTATLTDSGTAVNGSAEGGICVVSASDGTTGDNDEAYLGLRNLVFTMAANKPVKAWGRLQYTEANTDDANVAVGLTSSVAADLLVDNGAGLKTTGTHFAIYKVDGGTVWLCESRVGSTVLRNTTAVTAGGSSYFTWEVEISEVLTTHAVVVFKVNGEYLKDATTGMIISHRIAYSGASALTPFVAVKNGGTTGAGEVLSVDYIGAIQTRA